MPLAPPDPSIASRTHAAMVRRTRILRAVYAGTEGLLALGEELLPRYVKESDDKYAFRKKQARLRRNMFRQAVDRITGRIFQVPVRLVVDAPAPSGAEPGGAPVPSPQSPPPQRRATAPKPETRGEVIADDFDLRGQSLDRCGRTLYHTALKLGMMGALVEYPVVNAANLLEERQANARPYVVLIQPEDIIRYFEDDDGNCIHVAWKSTTVQWDAILKQEVEVQRVHERFPGRSVTWMSSATTNGWQLDPASPARDITVPGPNPTKIMFHLFYAEKEGTALGRTPLTEVADLTIEHFQISSDYRNALRQNLFPVLTATGIEEKNIGDITFTPETVLGSKNPQAKFQMLEHSGTALKAGADDLVALEQRAEAYAGQLTKPSGDRTATEAATNTAEVTSFAKDMALSLQDMLQAVLDDMATWEEVDTLGTVQVNLDFAVDFNDSDMTNLQSMRSSGDLSRQTLWREAQRRDMLGSDFDPDEEQRLLEDEAQEAMKREQQAMQDAHAMALDLVEAKGSSAPPPRSGA